MLECSYNSEVLYLIRCTWVKATLRTKAGQTNHNVSDVRFQVGSEL